MKQVQKRYQFFGKNGIKQWTKWFNYNGNTQEKIQLKSKGIILENEYRII